MKDFDVRETLLKRGYQIDITDSPMPITTGMTGPVGIKSVVHGGTGKAYYNRFASYLTTLFTDKLTNAVVFNDEEIYCLVTEKAKTYAMTFDGAVITCDRELPEFYYLLPVFYYTLSDLAECEESRKYFNVLKEEFFHAGEMTSTNVLMLCDALYYELSNTKVQKRIMIQENVNVGESLEMAIRKGAVSKIEALNKIDGLPKIFDKKTTTSSSKTTKYDYFEKAKNGEYLLDYDFKEKDYIHPLSYLNDFVPTKSYEMTLKKVSYRMGKVLERMKQGASGIDAIKNDYINMTFCGKPGTGKTVTAYALAASTGLPICTITNSKHTEEDKYEGETKVVNGQITTIESEFYKIFSSGGIILLEEFNLCDPAVLMGAIGQAIEFPFILKKNGYETVRRHPLCIIISTMNTGTAGTKKVNEAFSSRNKQTFVLDDPSQKEFIEILAKKGFDKNDCKSVYATYQKVIAFLTSPNINEPDACMNVTLRSCIGALECIEEGMNFKDAILCSIIGKIAENDLELAEKVFTSVSISM